MLIEKFNSGSLQSKSLHRLYVITDIHGHSEEFDNLLDQISHDISMHPSAKIEIVIAGDMIDRGPQSKQVLDRVANFDPIKMGDAKLTLLLGNHEIAFWQFMARPTNDLNFGDRRAWLYHGGTSTLASYGVFLNAPEPSESQDIWGALSLECVESARLEIQKKLPLSHRMLFKENNRNASKNSKREYWYKPEGHERGYFICHGGVDHELSLSDQPPCVLLGVDYKFGVSTHFSRYAGPALKDRNHNEWTVVHGHTIIGQVPVATDTKGRISADTGCFRGGKLSAIVIADGEYIGALQCPSFYPPFRDSIPSPENWPPKRLVNLGASFSL